MGPVLVFLHTHLVFSFQQLSEFLLSVCTALGTWPPRPQDRVCQYHLHSEGAEDLPVEEYLPILCGCTGADVDAQWMVPRTDELRQVISHALLSNYDCLSTGNLTE